MSLRNGDSRERGQSNVVGVAILLGVVVVSLGTLTAGIGSLVDGNAASADAARVASDLDAALEPVEATGVHRGRVSFTDGRLRTVERDLRVLNESGVVRTVRVDALVFTAGAHRVAFLAGAVVRGPPGNARIRTPPPITASRTSDDGSESGVLVVGAAKLNGTVGFGATGGGSALLRTDVSHRQLALGEGTYRVAVETATPGAWRRYFERRNATVTTRDFDGDGTPSVVATYPGERVAYLVVHDLRLEVRHG
jgi:flagellin-like protein